MKRDNFATPAYRDPVEVHVQNTSFSTKNEKSVKCIDALWLAFCIGLSR